MEYIFQVDMKSRDNNQYAFSTIAETEEGAEKKALREIIKNGWEHYGYRVVNISNKGKI